MRLKDRLALVIVAGVWGQPPLLGEAGALQTTQDNAGLVNAKPDVAKPDVAKPEAGRSGPSPMRRSDLSSRPGGGPAANAESETPAILRTSDFDRSDPRLAGLALRCGKNGAEIVIVVVEPFPPYARPKITLRVAEQEFYFVGSPIPTGAGVRLPVDGMELTTAAWLKSQEVGIKIADGDTAIEGVVPLSGLATAIELLGVACAPK